MDTLNDFIKEAMEDSLGASEEGFLEWINFSVGMEIKFHRHIHGAEKWSMILFLKETYWDDYIQDLEWAHQEDQRRYE